MDILLLGGPRFLGRAIIDAVAAAGHRLTLFNRGRTNADLYPQVEWLQGDRDGRLDALHGRRWDAVIDTCGYIPRVVRQSVELLQDAVDRYVFISTISVYAEPLTPGAGEDAPLANLDEPEGEEITGATYGGLKVLCEHTVQKVFDNKGGDRALIVRPGLIVGPHDPTNRFTYWVTRLAAGGPVLAPDDRSAPVQLIDVRDLAAWTVRMVETKAVGVYNATGPAAPLTFGETLAACNNVAGNRAEFVWVPPQFLLAAEVAPWTEIPLWTAGDDALNQVSIARALGHGLALRPLAATIADTLAWAQADSPSATPRAGLTRAREAELLHAYLSAPAKPS
jgi:2'-hydroxyisoflavone reductase